MGTQLFQDVWHGDSIEQCARFKPESVDCVITDPPFGVDNQSNQAVTAAGKDYARKIANDESPEIAWATFQNVMDVLLPKTKPDCDMYVFTSYQVLHTWMVLTDAFMPIHGFRRKAILIWEKDGPGMGDTNCPWGMGVEFIMFFQKGKREKSASRRNAVIRTPQIRPGNLIHPHEKPIPLLTKLIETSTSKLDFIVDPFGGSGSLARAAKATERSAICIEYDARNALAAKQKLDSTEESLFS